MSNRIYEESVILGLDLVSNPKPTSTLAKIGSNTSSAVSFSLDSSTIHEQEIGDEDENEDEFECKVGLVLPIYANSEITLDGDGGFKFVSHQTTHIFKPVSIQAMWSAYQYLHKAFENARKFNFYAQVSLDNFLAMYSSSGSEMPTPESLALQTPPPVESQALRQQHHEWVKYYSSLIAKYRTEQQYINEWYQKEERSVQREDFTTPYFDCLKLCKEQEVRRILV